MAAKDTGETQQPYANPLQTTGYWDDNSKVTMFDPTTGEYVTKDVDPDNIMQYNPGGDETNWAELADGTRVLMDTTGENWQDYGANPQEDSHSVWRQGATAPPPIQWRPQEEGDLSFGGDQVPIHPGDDDYVDYTPEPPLQPTPTPTPTPEPPPITNEPIDPDLNQPTDDWFWTDPVGYENAPQPDGDGSFVEEGPPADTSWDWNFFRDKAPGDRQWGGYDEDYQAFERYQPGMDSPWGMPNIEGGNEDFYQQQFVNQLRDEQGYQNRERQAQARRQEAFDTPYEAPTSEEMWKWANGGAGLPQTQPGGAEPTVNWDLNQSFNPGESTNADILRWATTAEGFGADDRKWYSDHLNNPKWQGGDSTAWGSAGDPSSLISTLPTDSSELSQNNQRRMTELFNSIYNRASPAPYAPAGYASPINAAPTG